VKAHRQAVAPNSGYIMAAQRAPAYQFPLAPHGGGLSAAILRERSAPSQVAWRKG